MADEVVGLYQGAFDLYRQLKDAGMTSEVDALRLNSGQYDKAAWEELRGLGLVKNKATPGLRYVDLYIVKNVTVRSRGPRPTRKRIPDSRRERPDGTALTIKDLSRFAGRGEELTSRLTSEVKAQAAEQVKQAQKAVGTATPGEIGAAMKRLEAALEAQTAVDDTVQRQVLEQLKPARGSREYRLWELLGSG